MSARDLTAFEALLRASDVRLPSVWQAAFDMAEAELSEVCPWGVDVLDIARAAWDCLPDEKARDEALDQLFYAWWEAEQDRKAHGQAGGAL
ncbi:hypothetical protein [Streptomyces sp. SID8499]|uniref:hypothetical protein n=1 Tax=Streptomyces sp. SID8499 TaxID=2706106 RepID=UPI0013CBAF15|nr:hypothetical protein [Streptomyces sp. SID8499]NED31020.1 hypothetical protein [Streptomyces sp. SID8499]